MESRVKCSYCDKTFAYKKHLYVHVRKIHEHEPLPITTKDFLCAICNKKYSNQKSLLAHTKKFHQDDSIKKRTKQSRIFCLYEDCQVVLITLVKQKKTFI